MRMRFQEVETQEPSKLILIIKISVFNKASLVIHENYH